MATFEEQVEGLTGLSITDTSNPTLDQLTQYIRDGVVEVTTRVISLKQTEIPRFCVTDVSSSTVDIKGPMLSVMRAHDSTDVLRRCEALDPGTRYDASDQSSLHYRSKYNPAFYPLDGQIHVVPAADSDNKLHITHVDYDDSVAYWNSTINNFPKEYYYLVALYSAMKSIHSFMDNLAVNLSTSGDIYTALVAAKNAMDRIEDNIYNASNNWDPATKRFKQAKTALDNAFKLFDGGFPSTYADLKSFLSQEDPEMIEMSLTSIQVELKTAETALTEISGETTIATTEAQGFFAEVTSRLGVLQAQYNWHDNKYKELKAEYDGAFMILAPPKQPPKGQE
tara:strand:+ start:177 stop:1190 length:1014 start_codon:yes stop_codon:yes gene_type:complete